MDYKVNNYLLLWDIINFIDFKSLCSWVFIVYFGVIVMCVWEYLIVRNYNVIFKSLVFYQLNKNRKENFNYC